MASGFRHRKCLRTETARKPNALVAVLPLVPIKVLLVFDAREARRALEHVRIVVNTDVVLHLLLGWENLIAHRTSRFRFVHSLHVQPIVPLGGKVTLTGRTAVFRLAGM